PSDGVAVLLGNGDGTFQPAQFYPANPEPFRIATGDFNGDGFPDLVVVNVQRGISVLINCTDWPPGPLSPESRGRGLPKPADAAGVSVPDRGEPRVLPSILAVTAAENGRITEPASALRLTTVSDRAASDALFADWERSWGPFLDAVDAF